MTKTISIKRRLALLLVLAFTCVAQGWANSKYYAKLTANVTPTGSGTVYVNTSNSDDGGTNYSPSSSKQDGGENKSGQKYTFYAFAKANSGYNFAGWAKTEDGDVISTTIPYTVEIQTPTEEGTKEETIYAKFTKQISTTITFLKPENGSYTASDGTNTITDEGTITTENTITLKATAKEGYKALGWYTTTDGGKTKTYFSFDASTSQSFSESKTVGCDFIPKDAPVFIVKTAPKVPYTDLTAADQAAGTGGVIVLISDGTLAKGSYTISNGHTLLIPYDVDNTVTTTTPTVTQTWKKPSCYKKLSLADGADITVYGAISVGGTQYSTSNRMETSHGGPGTPTGPLGQIDMSKGGTITLKSGSHLYAWGYITGQNEGQGGNTTGIGSIVAESGSKVYETFVIGDWHGGSATQKFDASKKVFPFNQYYIPNIEVPMTLEYGATEKTVCNIAAGLGNDKTPYNIPVEDLISNSSGLFLMKEGSTIKKWYDAQTDNAHFELSGNVDISSIEVNLAGYLTAKSSSYVLPLTSNMKIECKSGTLTVPNEVELLPGAKLTIDEGATAIVQSNAYLFDLDNWDGYAYSHYWNCLDFRITSHKTYTWFEDNNSHAKKDLSDACLDVNGTLQIEGSGKLYTTEAGANICSSKGTGKIILKTKPTATSTVNQIKDLSTEATINVTAAQLHNANTDYPYTATAGMTLDEDNGTSHTVYYRDGVWGPYFQYNTTDNGSLVLDNNYPVKATDVTKAVTEKCAESKPLSIDLSNADIEGGLTTDNIATLRAAMGATATTGTDGSTVAATNPNGLLLVPSTISGIDADETENVVVVTGTGDSRTVTAKSLVITDKKPIGVPMDMKATKATYTRSNSTYTSDGVNQWGTICLPYKVKSEGNIQYYKFTGLSDNVIHMEKVDEVEANTPALYAYGESGGTITISGEDIDVKATPAEQTPDNVKLGTETVKFIGVLNQEKIKFTADENSPYIYISKNVFYRPTKKDITLRPQRAYFKTNGTVSAKQFIISDDGTTGINDINSEFNEKTIVGYYTVNGTKHDSLQPGLNIVRFSDGTTQKVMVK